MPITLRRTKLRAKRIELDYFARRAPLRTWRVVLSLAGFALAAAWIALIPLRGRRQAAEPGPVSTAHALFGVRCEACHAGTIEASVAGGGAPRWQAATDAACQRCHAAPDHETNQASTPACGTCHAEHRGQAQLAATPANACIACHGDLDQHVKGTPRVVGADARAIHGFGDGHPEFAVWIAGRRVRLDAAPVDGAQLKLNHKLHLKPGLRGPAGAGAVQLGCGDCHQGPMALAVPRPGDAAPDPPSPGDAPDLFPAEEPAYMAPIRFTRHCAGCHPNTFDARFADMPAPHDRTEVVHAFLRGLYADYIVAHPDELADPRRRLLGREPTVPVATPNDWVRDQVSQAEEMLFRDPKRCQECHTLSWPSAGGLPAVAPTRVPVRWLPQSRYDHGVHRLLGCSECHASADSEKTTDVLLPTAKTCRGCHHPEGASDRCSECHTYHAATGPREMNGKQRVRDLASGTPATGG